MDATSSGTIHHPNAQPICVSVSGNNPNQNVAMAGAQYYESPIFHRRRLQVQVPAPMFVANGPVAVQVVSPAQQVQTQGNDTAMSVEPDLANGGKSWFAGIFAQKVMPYHITYKQQRQCFPSVCTCACCVCMWCAFSDVVCVLLMCC